MTDPIYPYYTPIPFPGDGLGGAKQPANAALWNSRYLELAVAIGNLASLAGLDSASVVAAILALDLRVDGVISNVDTIDARLDTAETDIAANTATIAGHTTEIVNGRGGFGSLDARMDDITADVATNTGNIATNTTAISINSAEIVAGRGGFGSLDARMDDITADVNTNTSAIAAHTTEIVAGRGDYSTLDDRLDDVYLRGGNVLLVDAAYSGDHANQWRYNDIPTALAACVGGETILIAPGIYTGSITVADDNVKLLGSGAPKYDSGTGRLVGGTIIRGRISLGSTIGTTISDLGVDMVGITNTDCISASGVVDTEVNRTYRNLTLLGNGSTSLAHGIYSPGNNVVIQNVRIYFLYHGIAVHGSYQNLSNIYCQSCYANSIILAAKDSVGSVQHININNIILKGDSSTTLVRAGPIAVTAGDNSGWVCKYVNIGNVTARNCLLGAVRIEATGDATISNVNVSNVVSYGNYDAAAEGDFSIQGAVTIVMYNNCQSLSRVGGFGFKCVPDGAAYLAGCYGDTSGSGATTGSFVTFGVNLFPPLMHVFSLGDDAATSFDLGHTSGNITISQGNSTTGYTMGGSFTFRAAATPHMVLLSSSGGSTILAAATGVLAGTTGADGKVTLSAHTDGLVYVENRSGGTKTFRLTLFG